MRRPLIAGNWKMNLTRRECVDVAQAIAGRIGPADQVEVAICPPYVYLDAVAHVVQGTTVGLGAQDMSEQAFGAFTGEICAAQLVDLGCRYVILGHSERRHLLGETNAQVNVKARAALAAGLTPIVCVGETLVEREADQTRDVIQCQLAGSLAGFSAEQATRIVLAYEPVWAIGTGQVATPSQAAEVHADLRRMLATRYNPQLAAAVRIQYGGSVKPDNAAELLALPDIDGALVGGASLKADAFLGIVAGARS